MFPTVFVHTMNRELVRALTFVVLFEGIAPIAYADLGENPYVSITRRNPFALRPAVLVTPLKLETPPTPAPPLVWLTGITDLPGPLTATFQYEDRQTRKVRYSALLREGQGDGTVTILHIDPVNSLVRVQCGEAELTLDFVRNGLKPVATLIAAVAPVPPPFRTAPQVTSDRVVIGNQPAWRPVPPVPSPPTLSREQAELIIEKRRAELRALEASDRSQPGRGGSIILPPTRLSTGGGARP